MDPKFFQTPNSFKTKILIRLKIFVEIFFGPKIFLDQRFLKPFQAELFRLESCLSVPVDNDCCTP